MASISSSVRVSMCPSISMSLRDSGVLSERTGWPDALPVMTVEMSLAL